jgi:hypothetical protein
MKYILKNKSTGQETLCDKVTIDGFDYYVNNEKLKDGDVFYNSFEDNQPKIQTRKGDWGTAFNQRKIIATDKAVVGIPKVINTDESFIYALKEFPYTNERSLENDVDTTKRTIFQLGYLKSKSTYKWTDEDMLAFGDWCENLQFHNKEIRRKTPHVTRTELFEIWREQQPKTIWYE